MTRNQHTAAQASFAGGDTHAADDQNASIAAAKTSMTDAPKTIELVSLAAICRDNSLGSRPGRSTLRPTRNPAPPQITMAVSSNAECVAMNVKKVLPWPRAET